MPRLVLPSHCLSVPVAVGWGVANPPTSIPAAPPPPRWGLPLRRLAPVRRPNPIPPPRSMGRTPQHGRGNRGTAAHLPVYRPPAPGHLVAPPGAAAARALLPALRLP